MTNRPGIDDTVVTLEWLREDGRVICPSALAAGEAGAKAYHDDILHVSERHQERALSLLKLSATLLALGGALSVKLAPAEYTVGALLFLAASGLAASCFFALHAMHDNAHMHKGMHPEQWLRPHVIDGSDDNTLLIRADNLLRMRDIIEDGRACNAKKYKDLMRSASCLFFAVCSLASVLTAKLWLNFFH